jgi:putative peptidoglycan lipid II flippase
VLGVAREVGVAFLFGTSVAADRLTAAFVVASLVSIVAGEALYAGSVRWLGSAAPGGVSERRYAELLRFGRRVALVATGGFALLGPALLLLVLGGGASALESIMLSLALAPSVGASLFVACVNARLTLEGRFALLNGVPILYSAGALVALAVLIAGNFDPDPVPVALGWSAGNLAAGAVLYLRARPAAAPSCSSGAGLELLTIGLPLAIAYALTATLGFTDRAVAARLGSGNVAALGYADRLFLLPIGFVLAALGPIVFGALVAGGSAGPRWVAQRSQAQLRALTLAVVPLSLVFTALAAVLVELLFQSGEFGERSTDLTVDALDGFAIGIAAVAVSLVLFRMMQAIGQMRWIVTVSLVAVVLNIALSVAGAAWLGLFGVTLATTFVALATVALQIVALGGTLGRAWTVGVWMGVGIPVALSCAISLAVVSALQAGAIGGGARIAILLAAGAAAAVVLGRRWENWPRRLS